MSSGLRALMRLAEQRGVMTAQVYLSVGMSNIQGQVAPQSWWKQLSCDANRADLERARAQAGKHWSDEDQRAGEEVLAGTVRDIEAAEGFDENDGDEITLYQAKVSTAWAMAGQNVVPVRHFVILRVPLAAVDHWVMYPGGEMTLMPSN